MKHVTQKFPRKALSIICALAILLSCVSVSFSAVAETPVDATQYVVDADKSPAIPMFAGTKIDLNNVSVLFKDDETATPGSEITWALGGDYGQNLVLGEDGYLTAFLKGNEYKIKATAGEKEVILWVVVANFGDEAWNLYSIDFDAYTEQYSKLEFKAKPLYAEKQQILNPNNNELMKDSSGNVLLSQCTDFIFRYDSSKKTYYVFPYQSGVWSYSGVEFTYDAKTGESTVPAGVAFPEGWSSYMTPPNTNGIGKLFKLPHVMPYDLSAGLHTDSQVNAVSENRKGIMPFANPYLFDGWNMSELGYEPFHFYNAVNNAFANSAKGFFVLDNEITKSFSDFVINTNLNYNAYNPNQNQGLDTVKYLQIYARMPLTSNGMPSKDVLLPGTLKSYNSNGEVAELVNAVNFQSIGINAYKEGNTKYGYISRFDYSGDNAKTVSSVPYGSNPYNGSGKTPMKWDYLMKLNKQGSVSNVQAHTGVNVDLTIKYEGESAFVTSREDSTKTEIVFNDVLGDKGAIAIGMNSLSIEPQYDATAGTSISQWVNVHQFSIDLVNDITADNDGTEYPFYEKIEFIPIVDATVEEGYVAGQNIFFNTLSAAIRYLGENGGTVYIKGEYTVTDANTDFAATANIAEGKKLVLEGFDGSNDGNIINFGTSTAAISLRDCFYSDIEFKNLTVNRAKDWEGCNLNSNGKTIVFGEGLKTDLAGYSLSQIKGGVSNNIVINSGTYSGRHYIHRGSSVTQAGSNYNLTINGGEFTTDIHANIYSDSNFGRNDKNEVVGKNVYINGDVTLNINGGIFNNKNISTSRSGAAASSVHGIIRINVNAATNLGLIGLVAGVYNTTDSVDGTIAPYYNHIVARVDHRYSNSKINSQLKNIDKFADNNGKKYIAIANYSDNQYDITNSALGLDYALIVDGGEADVVFEGAGEEAVFKGFSFTPSAENIDKNVVVNEKVIKPDANGVYDLSEFEDIGIVMVNFQGDTVKNYAPYVGFGNDFDNSYAKLTNPDATVNVVYMGGSITNGDGLKNTNASWRARSAMWLGSNFASKVQHFNVAVSSTGTNYGMYRTYNDVISKNPDILFIEFSINDSYDGVEAERSGAQLETIIREVKSASPDCDIVVVLTTDMSKVVDAMDGKLHPQAEAHEKIAKAYGIPIMYVGKALANELDPAVKTDAKLLKAEWARYAGDSVHPNATGHDIYYKVIRTFLESVYSGSYTADNKNVDTTDDSTIVSKKLYDGNRIIVYGDKTVYAKNANGLYSVDTSKTLENIEFNGFTFENSEIANFANNYTGYLNLRNGTNGTLSTTFSGTEFIVLGNFVAGDVLLYSIDGSEEQSLVFEGQNRFPAILVKDIEKGNHTITIRFDWEKAKRTADLVIYAIGSRDASIATGLEKKEVVTDESVIAEYKNGVVPEKKGYLFGGFIDENGKALTADEIKNAESLTVKFIPKAVLKIGWQIAKGENGTASLRLISTVDSLQYKKVIFVLKAAGRDDMVLESKMVYTGIKGFADGENVEYDPSIFSSASEYFMTHIISGIPETFHDVDFTVTASLVTKDEKVITGDAVTFTLKSANDYDAVMGK